MFKIPTRQENAQIIIFRGSEHPEQKSVFLEAGDLPETASKKWGGAKFHLSQEIQLLYESSKSDYFQFGLATLEACAGSRHLSQCFLTATHKEI